MDLDFVGPELGGGGGGSFSKKIQKYLNLQHLQKHINMKTHCQGFERDLQRKGP